jgi:hypothetical protein
MSLKIEGRRLILRLLLLINGVIFRILGYIESNPICFTKKTLTMLSKSTFRLLALLVVTSLLFANCKKGDAGPEGPAGPAGPQGPQGTAGAAGTANVIYSGWLDVKFDPTTDPDLPAGTYEGSIAAPKLTPAILASGDMKVYVNFGSAASPDVVPLPINDPFYGIVFIVDFLPQTIYITANGNASTMTDNNVKYRQYRYILIPGGTQARKATIDWNNYEEVKKTFNIPD